MKSKIPKHVPRKRDPLKYMQVRSKINLSSLPAMQLIGKIYNCLIACWGEMWISNYLSPYLMGRVFSATSINIY